MDKYIEIIRNENRRGVYSNVEFSPGQVIEICELIIIKNEYYDIIKQTSLDNYIYSWNDSCCIALGNGSLYNHSFYPNATYTKDYQNNKIIIFAIDKINPGDEILINYNMNTK